MQHDFINDLYHSSSMLFHLYCYEVNPEIIKKFYHFHENDSNKDGSTTQARAHARHQFEQDSE
jgi:hypothetical protein